MCTCVGAAACQCRAVDGYIELQDSLQGKEHRAKCQRSHIRRAEDSPSQRSPSHL